jgi:hypothetical protein
VGEFMKASDCNPAAFEAADSADVSVDKVLVISQVISSKCKCSQCR